MSELTALLVDLLAVLLLAFVVRVAVRNVQDVAYASALVGVGVVIAVLGVSPGIELGHDLVLSVLLPALVFEGTIELDLIMITLTVYRRSPLPLAAIGGKRRE